MNKAYCVALLALSAMTGCAGVKSPRNVSSEAIGCEPNDIRIANAKTSPAKGHEWVATCKGKKFICHDDATLSVECKEVTSPDLAIEQYEDRDDWW